MRSTVLFPSIGLLACVDQIVCPEPAPTADLGLPAEPISNEPPASVAPLAAVQEPEPEEDEDEDEDEQVARLEFNTFAISVRVGEHDDDDDDPSGFVRVEVRNGRTEGEFVIERPAEFDCLVSNVEPSIDVIFSDEETMVFDASYLCGLGEIVRRVDVEHLVIALEYGSDDAGVLYQGTSTTVNNRGLAVSVDKREFYVEADKLAIYRHSVEWCDRQSLIEATGHAHGCGKSARKLELLKRVPIGVVRTR